MAKVIWADFPAAAPDAAPLILVRVSRVPRTWACYFTLLLHTSSVILIIPGEHGENIDPVCLSHLYFCNAFAGVAFESPQKMLQV